MGNRASAFLIEPDRWAFEAEEVVVREERLRTLLEQPDAEISDAEMVLTLLDLLRDEAEERSKGEDGFLSAPQFTLAMRALAATAQRAGWTSAD